MAHGDILSDLVAMDVDGVVASAQTLIAAASPNPPGDTAVVADAAARILRAQIPELELGLHPTGAGVVNLVARVFGARAGRRLVFNGHLDTYPINEALPWTVDPVGGVVRDGNLYGRGAADMKGGIACSIAALAALARHRQHWDGEAVITLAGDEESMGVLGTQWLIENIAHASGDAVVIGDAGSPRVIRFGEKGFLWIEMTATGRAAHGAHVHLGTNAIDRLRRALDALSDLPSMAFEIPAEVASAIAVAQSISEPLSGAGEAAVLGAITVNIGRIDGGTSMNLVPITARAQIDIRLPPGVETSAVEREIVSRLDGIEGISWRALRRVEPSVTDPSSRIVQIVREAAQSVLGVAPAVNMRVGGSDARLYRRFGMPTVVYGPTPFNMGGADEHVMISDLAAVAKVHAIAAYRFLTAPTV